MSRRRHDTGARIGKTALVKKLGRTWEREVATDDGNRAQKRDCPDHLVGRVYCFNGCVQRSMPSRHECLSRLLEKRRSRIIRTWQPMSHITQTADTCTHHLGPAAPGERGPGSARIPWCVLSGQWSKSTDRTRVRRGSCGTVTTRFGRRGLQLPGETGRFANSRLSV